MPFGFLHILTLASRCDAMELVIPAVIANGWDSTALFQKRHFCLMMPLENILPRRQHNREEFVFAVLVSLAIF